MGYESGVQKRGRVGGVGQSPQGSTSCRQARHINDHLRPSSLVSSLQPCDASRLAEWRLRALESGLLHWPWSAGSMLLPLVFSAPLHVHLIGVTTPTASALACTRRSSCKMQVTASSLRKSRAGDVEPFHVHPSGCSSLGRAPKEVMYKWCLIVLVLERSPSSFPDSKCTVLELSFCWQPGLVLPMLYQSPTPLHLRCKSMQQPRLRRSPTNMA